MVPTARVVCLGYQATIPTFPPGNCRLFELEVRLADGSSAVVSVSAVALAELARCGEEIFHLTARAA